MLLRKVVVENFRGLVSVEVELDRTTVLIGENNSGKTSFIDAIRLCLERSLYRRANAFEDYDHHLGEPAAQPGDAGELSVTFVFGERRPDEWHDEIVQALGDVIVVTDGRRQIALRVKSGFDDIDRDFTTEWEFLDGAGNSLPPKTKRPNLLQTLQQFKPFFYLSALRDAAREFHPRAALWGRFLRNPAMSPEVRAELEAELTALNAKILQAEPRLEQLQRALSKVQQLVRLAQGDAVSLEALPARVWDILARAQVSVAGASGAALPLSRHGSGTQSLAVVFLFEAFLTVMLTQAYDEYSESILAVEEPEAHLHPCAVRGLWKALDALDGQKIIATHSGEFLAEAPLTAIRRFHRHGGTVRVYRLREGTLSAEDARKLHYHVLKTRGELLFAKCWLMGEGPTEYWVFSETARALGVDLESLGIRIVLYSNVGAVPFVKLANDLGISWHCVADGDKAGQDTLRSLRPHLNGRPEAQVTTPLPWDTMERFLCEGGYGKVYESYASDQKRHALTAKPGDPEYWKQVLACLPNRFPKEEAAIAVMMEVRRGGPSAVPPLLAEIVRKVEALANS